MPSQLCYLKAKYLCKLGQIFGIVSPDPQSSSLFYTVSTVCLSTTSITCLVYSIWGKCSKEFDGYNPVVKFTDQLACILLTITTEIITIYNIFLYPELMHHLAARLDNFDEMMKIRKTKLGKFFWTCLALLNISSLSIIAFDSYVWVISVGLPKYSYYAMRNVQYFKVTMAVFFSFWLTIEVYIRFKILNLRLTRGRLYEDGSIIILKTRIDRSIKLDSKDIRVFARMYDFLCETVDLLNNVIGMMLLFLVLFVIVFVIQHATTAIYYFSMTGRIDHIGFDEKLLIDSCLWMVLNFIIVMALASGGENLSKEAANTIKICYGIIHRLNYDADVENQQMLKELKHLAQQIALRDPKLSANGFFVVNYNMIGFIVTSITSYIIVAVQMMKENN